MFSLNKKAFTIIELVVSFTFVVILLSSLFIIVMNYQNKTEKEKIKSSLLSYKDSILNIVYHDIVADEIKEVKQCGNKCVELVVNTNESYVLAADSDDDGNEYLSYRDLKYNLPDSINKLSSIDDFVYKVYDSINAGNNKIFELTIPILHAEITEEENKENAIKIIISGKKLNIDEPLDERIYTINYYLGNGLDAGDANAGVTYIGSSTCKYGSACTLKSWESFNKIFPKSEYRWQFAGWSSSKTVASLMYNDKESFNYDQTNNINLYAIGSRTFNFFSGIAPTKAQSVQVQYWNPYSTYQSHLTSIDVPIASSIDGWMYHGYVQSNTASSTVAITAVGEQIFEADMYQYTNFRCVYKRTISVEYNANNGIGTIESVNKTQYYNSGSASNNINEGAKVNNVTITLADNTFKRVGYKFSEWAEDSTNGTMYSEGTKYNFTKGVSDSNIVTMYAIWTKMGPYVVNYYLGNGTSTADVTLIGTSTCEYNGTCKLTLWNNLGATFPGASYRWKFVGWSESKTLPEFKYSDAEEFVYEKEGNLNLYALGSRTFTFFSGKAPTTAKSIQTQYWNPYSTHASHASSITVPTATGLGNGWTFYGYLQANSVNGNVQLTSIGEQVLDVEKYTGAYFRTVYSRTATIKYNANGGTGTTADTIGVQYYNSGYATDNINIGANNSTIDMVLSDNKFTYSGYNFDKWAKGSESGTKYEAGSIYTFDNNVSQSYLVNMYATWTIAQVCNSSCGSCLSWSDWLSRGVKYRTVECAAGGDAITQTEKWSNCSIIDSFYDAISTQKQMCTYSCDYYVKNCTQYPCC